MPLQLQCEMTSQPWNVMENVFEMFDRIAADMQMADAYKGDKSHMHAMST